MATSTEIAKNIERLEHLLEKQLEESSGEVTDEVDSILKEIEKSKESAESKLDSLEAVINTLKAKVDSNDAMADYYSGLSKKMSTKSKGVKSRIDYLKSLAYRLVSNLPTQSYISEMGTKIYIHKSESMDDSNLTEQEKMVLVEHKIGEKVETYKVLKSDLKIALADKEMLPEDVQVILDKVFYKHTSRLRGL